ncbi:hypothetical protein J3Q64DRAFT_1739138 [Phycomyces blakesleeanus]|uniref:VHS domain-containing protein n=1 Tax=Phycomyces blakesleeanus TaxID=4837 RepID=A0ABR3B376_PHYBL
MPLFSKKILPTEITADIERATNPNTTELDWSIAFKLCESVNKTDLGAKEARKLLQKKMLSREPNTQLLALELLNALSENCKEKFKSQLSAKSFGENLETLANSKHGDDRVHGKLVQCLQNWMAEFGRDPAFVAIHRVYDNTLDASIGQYTAQRPRQGPNHHHSERREQVKAADPKTDCELAKNSAQLFSQTLSFTDPTQEDITKNQLIQEFYAKCQSYQTIMSSHLQTCEDPDVISELLEANNELVNCFKTYDDMLERKAMTEATFNSQNLNHRNTQDALPSRDTEAGGSRPIEHSNPFDGFSKSVTLDPFDPFADSQQVDDGPARSNDTGGAVNLPPPLTPQKLHN